MPCPPSACPTTLARAGRHVATCCRAASSPPTSWSRWTTTASAPFGSGTVYTVWSPIPIASSRPCTAWVMGQRATMAGWDVEVESPVEVPLDIALKACASPGYLAAHVKAALAAALGAGTLAGGRRAFFYPDNFTFGEPLFISALYRAALAVPGVKSLVIEKLERMGQPSTFALDRGELAVGRFEVIRCDSDPSFPDHGRLALEVV